MSHVPPSASSALTPFLLLRACGWKELGAVTALLLALTDFRWLPDPVLRIAWDAVLVALGAGCVLLWSNGVKRSHLIRNSCLWALLSLACLSCFWSIGMHVTVLQSLALLAKTGLGVLIGAGLRSTELSRVLYLTFLGLIVMSALAVWVEPDSGRTAIGFRGAAPHKNLLGSAAAFGGLFYLTRLVAHEDGRFWSGGLCLTCGALLALSNSATSVLGFVAGISAVFVCRRRPGGSAFPLGWLAVAACAGGLFVLGLWKVEDVGAAARENTESVQVASSCEGPAWLCGLTKSLNRDVSLSGRLEIWQRALEKIHDRPLFGYGYGTLWPQGSSQPHAHNSYLQVAAELGIPAALLLLGVLIQTTWTAAGQIRGPRVELAIFAVAFSAAIAVMALAESYLLTDRFGLWPLYLAVAFGAQQASKSEAT